MSQTPGQPGAAAAGDDAGRADPDRRCDHHAPAAIRMVRAGEITQFRYYDFAMAAFVAILLLSNLIGAAKVSEIAYVLGDVLTEVYGYGRARRVVWAGFAAMVFMAFMSAVVVALPPAEGWRGQTAYEEVFGITPRIVMASLAAFWIGEFANSYVMARMKVWTQGRLLWTRTIGSTIVGEGLDSLIFYPLAFAGVWPAKLLLAVMASNFALKVGWEAALTPLTYRIVGWLKRAEGVDIYDIGTDFTPFTLKDR